MKTFTAIFCLWDSTGPSKKVLLPQVLACFMGQKSLQSLWLSQLHFAWKIKFWVKESNLTLSPSGQDPLQGVCSPRSMGVITNFAMKSYNKQSTLMKGWCPRTSYGRIVECKAYPLNLSLLKRKKKKGMREYKRSTIPYPQIRAVSERKMG